MTTKTPSFDDCVRERQTAIDAVTSEQRHELELFDRDAAERRQLLCAAHAARLAEVSAPFDRRAAEITRAFHEWMFELLPPVIEQFAHTETTAAATSVATAWQAVNARARHDTGGAYTTRALVYFIADYLVSRRPESADAFGAEQNWHCENDAGRVGLPYAELTLARALDTHAPSAIRDGLRAVIAELERVGQRGTSATSAAAERWHRSRRREGELISRAEAEATRQAEAIASSEAEADLIRRARAGEDIPGRDGRWHEAARALDENLFGKLKAAGTELLRGVFSSGQ